MTQFADDAAVDDRCDQRARVRRGDDAVDPGARAGAEPLHPLGAVDHVPALLPEHLGDTRVAGMHGDPERAAVELAEVDLSQLRHDDRLEPGGRGQRRRRLGCAAQRRHEQRLQRLVRERRGYCVRLQHAFRCEPRVGLALEQLERLPLDRGLRRAVPHEHDLDRAGRA